jgi:hypothetical protein
MLANASMAAPINQIYNFRNIYAEHNPPASYSQHGILGASPGIGDLVLKGAKLGKNGIWNALVETTGPLWW